MDIVTMEQVTKVYGENETRVWGLHNVDLTVEKGETLAIVGASGSGKSTLLHVMGGVDTPTSGKIVVDGKDITKMNDEQMSVFRRRKIGFVFQAYHLIPVLSVEENITMPILLDHRKPDKEYVEHIMELLGIADRRKHLPNQLSGGQQQRAAIARALASAEYSPSVVLIVLGNADKSSLVTSSNMLSAPAFSAPFFIFCPSSKPSTVSSKPG